MKDESMGAGAQGAKGEKRKSVLVMMKSKSGRKYFARVSLPKTRPGDRQYKYFYSKDEYGEYLNKKAGIKSPPDFGKSMLFGSPVVLRKSQRNIFGGEDEVKKPGSRGGKYFVDEKGNVRYGVKSVKKVKKEKPQFNLFGGEDEESNKKLSDEEKEKREKKNFKKRELDFVLQKIKEGKVPKGVEKLVRNASGRQKLANKTNQEKIF